MAESPIPSGPQYAFRAQKTAAVIQGPAWDQTSVIPADTAAARSYAYSPDGEYIAHALASSVQLVSTSSNASPQTLSQPNVLALAFSPLSTYLFTFERPLKVESGEMHKNVKVWEVKSGQEVGGWYHKNMDDWIPNITPDETHLIRSGASDITIFSPPLASRPIARLRIDGVRGIFISSPTTLPEGSTNTKPVKAYAEPAVAVWVGEKKGAPASMALYPLSSLIGSASTSAITNGDGETKTETRDMPPTTARKAFYQADKISVKWNNAGTMVLFLTHTDVDATGKSYYGETNLYLVGLDGSFDGLVDLDKEGPIYDFNWHPSSREFVVCYGYMPARTQLFDTKAKPIHSFGSQHRNFTLYQPQGKLLLSAGFGNLAGAIDIWDVSTRDKVAGFTAANSSHCEWSPCGRFILTATLSPRLRVDNGIKIWWCGGQLLHIQPQDEMYQASFAPRLSAKLESFPATLPKAPEANASVALYRPKGETSNGGESKPAGAYRPPGARGTVASDAYTRRDDDGPSSSASGTTTPSYTPMFKGGKPSSRYIPGAPPPGAAPRPAPEEDKKKRTRKRPGKDNKEEVPPAAPVAPVAEMENLDVAGGEDDALAKKIRNLTKKLKAIEDLKVRLTSGEVLEKTQLKKIESEQQVRSEIAALGGTV